MSVESELGRVEGEGRALNPAHFTETITGPRALVLRRTLNAVGELFVYKLPKERSKGLQVSQVDTGGTFYKITKDNPGYGMAFQGIRVDANGMEIGGSESEGINAEECVLKAEEKVFK